MSFLTVLFLAQTTPFSYSPELEALMRHRDEKRRQETAAQVIQQNEKNSLASVIPRATAERLSTCLTTADMKPDDGISAAAKWAGEGGGAYAAQCRGYALGKAGRFAEAAAAFESGARGIGVEPEALPRLWSQAGNAALVAGDVPRALADFDAALEKPLPATLATAEIHLDRARARVANNDLKGARSDIDQTIQMGPADPLAWLLSATLARRMDDLPMARAHIEQAAKLARNDGNVALEQGVIYALSGDRDPAARAAFQRASEVSAKDSDVAKKAQAYLAQLPVEQPAPPAKK